MGRAPCCEKIGLRRGRWTREEDEILTKYIQSHGEGSWRSLPKNAGLLRCGKSCRLRWINYLRSDLKRGNITPEEQQLILHLHSSFGNRWSLIASHLPGRTDNEIKNYWNSHVSKGVRGFTKRTTTATTGSDQPPPTAATVGVSNTGTAAVTTNKKRKRRSWMKKKTLMSSSSQKRSRENEDDVQRENLITTTGPTTSVPVIEVRDESKEIRGSHVDMVNETDKLLGLGPYEWLDSEMMTLDEFLLQDESVDLDVGLEGFNHGTATEMEKALVAASCGESNDERYNDSSSRNNNNSSSSSVNDWFDWEWMMRNADEEEASDHDSSPKDSQVMIM